MSWINAMKHLNKNNLLKNSNTFRSFLNPIHPNSPFSPSTKSCFSSSSSPNIKEERKINSSIIVLLLPCVLTFGLGTWQIMRRDEKIKVLEKRKTMLNLPPEPLSSVLAKQTIQTASPHPEPPNSEPLDPNVAANLLSELETVQNLSSADGSTRFRIPEQGDEAWKNLEFRPVTCTGKFDETRNVYIGPRVKSKYGVTEDGYFVITPLIPPFDSFQPPVLVNRGWVSSKWKEEKEKEINNNKNKNLNDDKNAKYEEEKKESDNNLLNKSKILKKVQNSTSENEKSNGEDVSKLQKWPKNVKNEQKWTFSFFPFFKTKVEKEKEKKEEEKKEDDDHETIHGIVRSSDNPSYFVPSNSPNLNLWFFVDVPAIAQHCNLPTNTLLVEAVNIEGEGKAGRMQEERKERGGEGEGERKVYGEEGKDVIERREVLEEKEKEKEKEKENPIPKELNDFMHSSVSPESHLTYAITWYTLSLAGSIITYNRILAYKKFR